MFPCVGVSKCNDRGHGQVRNVQDRSDRKMKCICIDGPMEGCDVGLDELMERQRMFLPEERLNWFLDEYSGG